jgi:hypothetical protein
VKTYLLLLSGLNLLLAAFIIITFEKSLLVYAQKLDNNDTEIIVSTPTKANATETANKKNMKYCYDSQFGSLGTGDGQFNRPHDIVFDSKGFLYINDRELNNFQKFFIDGKFIKQWGSEGKGPGQLTLEVEHLKVDKNYRILLLMEQIILVSKSLTIMENI